jgi:NCS1 family nucleobase:cation symporter-1
LIAETYQSAGRNDNPDSEDDSGTPGRSASMAKTTTQETIAGRDHSIIEARGIDHIPPSERRGSPWQLGAMWSGVVLNVQVVVYGALLVVFGLSPWQCVAAIAIGSLTWIFAGLASLAGPAAGTTAFTVTRAPFGRNGARPLAAFNWIMQVGYEVLDLVLMVLAVSALLGMAGVHVGRPLQIALIVALSVGQSLLPLVGHAAITRALHALVVPFAAVFVILAWLTASRLHLHDSAPAGWAAFLGGIALAASGSGLGWAPNAPDYSRYLPVSASRAKIVAAVTLGGGIPQALLMLLGVGVAFVAPDASDPVGGLQGHYPSWFLVLFLLLLTGQMGALNAVDLYSSGVTLQAAGLKVARWQAVVLDGVICTVIWIVVVFSGSFNTFLSNFLLFMIVWFAPWTAILIVDYLLRRGRYDIASLDSVPGGRYIRRGGVHRPGVIAQALGMAASLLWIDTSVFTGPLSRAGNGIDLSVPAGLIVGGLAYLGLAARGVRAESAARLPAESAVPLSAGFMEGTVA